MGWDALRAALGPPEEVSRRLVGVIGSVVLGLLFMLSCVRINHDKMLLDD